MIELFAGKARLCRLARAVGVPCAAHELLFDPACEEEGGRSSMDFNKSAGFMLLV